MSREKKRAREYEQHHELIMKASEMYQSNKCPEEKCDENVRENATWLIPRRQPKKRRLVETVNTITFNQFMIDYVPAKLRDEHIRLTHENGVQEYVINIFSSSSIPEKEFEACFELVRLTSSETYRNSSSKWSPSKKKKEMKLRDMKYMILRKQGLSVRSFPDIGGFLSFMITYEDGIEVSYCYEVHLPAEMRNKGLGTVLMDNFEEIGRCVGVRKSMLTVFKSNTNAINFYEHRGYAEDDFSPRPMKLRNGTIRKFDYMIYSKDLANGVTHNTKHHDIPR